MIFGGKNYRPLKLIFKIALSLFCFYAIYKWMNPINYFHKVAEIKIRFFICAIFTNFLYLFLNSIKLTFLFPSIRKQLKEIFFTNLIAVFFRFFLPGGVGGDIARFSYLRELENSGSKSQTLAILLLDRLTGFWCQILVTLMAWLWISRENHFLWIFFVAGLVFLFVISWLSLWGFRWLSICVQFFVSVYAKFRKQPVHEFENMGDFLMEFLSNKIRFVKVVVLSLVSEFVVLMSLMLLDRSLGGNLNWAQAILFLFFYTVVQTIPVTFGNWGVIEGTFGLLYQNIGSERGMGVLISLLVRAMNLPAALLGWWLFLVYRSKPKDSLV